MEDWCRNRDWSHSDGAELVITNIGRIGLPVLVQDLFLINWLNIGLSLEPVSNANLILLSSMLPFQYPFFIS